MHDNTTTHPSAVAQAFTDIEDIIEDVRAGKMVIMVDDESRENEGDLLMAAEKVRPQDINYMATHGRGLICLMPPGPSSPPTTDGTRAVSVVGGEEGPGGGARPKAAMRVLEQAQKTHP